MKTFVLRGLWIAALMGLTTLSMPSVAADANKDLVILPNAKYKTLKLNNNVVIFDATKQKSISKFSATEIALSKEIAEIKVGSVLNSGPCAAAPLGFNVKVTAIKKSGKGSVLTCSQAALADVFAECEFEMGDKNYRPDFERESAPKLASGTIGSGSGVLDAPINVNFKVTYASGKGFLQANVKGHAWIYMYYRRTGIFGDKDDYLRTGVGMAFNQDRNNPDFLIKTGGKFELKTPRVNLPSLAFWVGPVWIYFSNSAGAGLKIEGTTEMQAGVDLYGHAWVDCLAEANKPVVLVKESQFRAEGIGPQITNKGFSQYITVSPYVDVQAKLYNSDQFVFFGEGGLRTDFGFDPAKDINTRIRVAPYLKGGVKGKFSRWDYSFDQTFLGWNIYDEKFIIDIYRDPLGLASNNSRVRTFKGTRGYLSSENNQAPIKANRSSVGDWERFDIHYNRDGSYSFIANNDQMLAAAQNGLSTAVYASGDYKRSDFIGNDERFYIHRQSNGKYRIQGKLGYPQSWWYDWGGRYSVQQYLAASDWEIR